MSKPVKIKWFDEPEGNDYPAATSYLSLIYDEHTTSIYIDKLRAVLLSEFKAKDIFRAANLPLLDVSNTHVRKDRQKLRAGNKLSPLLLVRNSANGRVIISDGYHRLCAVYSYNEDAVIPCKII